MSTLEERILSLVRAIARGHAGLARDVVDACTSEPDSLLRTALAACGSAERRAVIDRHIHDPVWSRRIPLLCQEYRTLLPTNLRLQEPLKNELRDATWSNFYIRAFEDARLPPARVASELLRDLDALAGEAARFAELAALTRARVVSPLHLLQSQLLTRMALVIGSTKGRTVLEIGPEDGGLFFELERLGAEVSGVDLDPQFAHARLARGDFMRATLPDSSFDVIVATAVFESGSERAAGVPAAGSNLTTALLDRFVALLKPSGHVFLENLVNPVPFSVDDAASRGLDVVDVRVTGVNFAFGGRGCALRLRAEAKRAH